MAIVDNSLRGRAPGVGIPWEQWRAARAPSVTVPGTETQRRTVESPHVPTQPIRRANITQVVVDDTLLPWPEPEPLGEDLLPVPPFDPAMLPEAFRQHVEDVATRMQVPIDLLAVCSVAALAGCVNRRVIIQPKRADSSWIVTPNLWAATVAPPGRMKSDTLAAFTFHLKRIEGRWRMEYGSELEEYEQWDRERRLRGRAWEQQFVAAAKKGVSPPIQPDETRTKPSLRRLLTNDPTHEALHQMLAQNPAGLLLERDELAGWFASLDKPGREGERQFFLESWKGDTPFTMDRIGRGTIYVPALCLSIAGGIQPGRLRQYLTDAVKDGPGNDGLFQRLQLIVWPDFRKAWTLVDRPPNRDAAERIARVYARLVALSADEQLRLKFADDAQELFFDWWTKLEHLIRSGELHRALEAHFAKYRSLMPSLSLLFELADADDPSTTTHVSLGHAAQGAAWCDYLGAHARRIYGCLVAPELHAARVLSEKIHKLPDEFSSRDVYMRHWESLSTPEEARAGLRVLRDAAWIRSIPEEAGTGRPSERWVKNPRIAEVSGEQH